jgi:mono/diheme cytochrome c family protein
MKVTFTFKPLEVLLAGALAAAAMAGCAASGGVVPVFPGDEKWASERWPGTTMNDLAKGHDVFVSRCSSCHGLPRPDAKSPDEWNGVLDEMAARAKLSSEDRELVNRYLSAASQRLRSRAALTRADPGKSSL